MSFDITDELLDFNIEYAVNTLIDIQRLEIAFLWSESREGFEFWAGQYDLKELTEEGRKSLLEMIQMWEDSTKQHDGVEVKTKPAISDQRFQLLLTLVRSGAVSDQTPQEINELVEQLLESARKFDNRDLN